jgi:hypothetical protein
MKREPSVRGLFAFLGHAVQPAKRAEQVELTKRDDRDDDDGEHHEGAQEA